MARVLITEGRSGLGLALARVFARKSYDLMLVGRSVEKLFKAKYRPGAC